MFVLIIVISFWMAYGTRYALIPYPKVAGSSEFRLLLGADQMTQHETNGT